MKCMKCGTEMVADVCDGYGDEYGRRSTDIWSCPKCEHTEKREPETTPAAHMFPKSMETIRKALGTRPLVDAIRRGDHVTIVDRFGQTRKGKAVMLGPAGWVLNMGGPHGTPAIATSENVVKVHRPRSTRR